MSSLTVVDKKYLDSILAFSSGWVLDFTDQTFKEFFKNSLNVNIYDEVYAVYGHSKGKRLKRFFEINKDDRVGIILKNLLDLWKIDNFKNADKSTLSKFDECTKIVNRLLGIKTEINVVSDFIKKDFGEIKISKLYLDPQLEPVIKQRIEEIKTCLSSKASLSVVFLCGSTIEGLLIDLAAKNIEQFNRSKSSPKKNNVVKKIQDWTLADLIEVAYTEGFIEIDIKKYSHSLRDFRNYIHPRQQAIEQFNPDKHTAEISWKVLQAVIASLSNER